MVLDRRDINEPAPRVSRRLASIGFVTAMMVMLVSLGSHGTVGASGATGAASETVSTISLSAEATNNRVAGNQQQQPQSDPAEVREEIGRILEDGEFSYEKSVLGRFLDWLLEQLGKLIPDQGPSIEGGVGVGPGLGAIVVAVVLIAAAAAVVVLAIIRLRRRRGRNKVDDAEADVLTKVRANEPEDGWLDEALDMETAGDWKGSVLLRYRRLVEELVRRGRLESTPGLTPGELRADLRSSMPAAEGLFDEATQLFEDPWYGDEPTGSGEVERLETISSEILSAEASPRTEKVVGR